ncbi:unnamed protein product, partial [Prorocentrum cordatum]
MSNTLCVSDAVGEWAVVGAKLVQELSEFGEAARLDAVGGTLGTVLATYFHARCAQSVLLHMAPRAEPFQSAPQDCRIVLADLPGFLAKRGCAARLQDLLGRGGPHPQARGAGGRRALRPSLRARALGGGGWLRHPGAPQRSCASRDADARPPRNKRAGDVTEHLLARTRGSSGGLQELDITPGA